MWQLDERFLRSAAGRDGVEGLQLNAHLGKSDPERDRKKRRKVSVFGAVICSSAAAAQIYFKVFVFFCNWKKGKHEARASIKQIWRSVSGIFTLADLCGSSLSRASTQNNVQLDEKQKKLLGSEMPLPSLPRCLSFYPWNSLAPPARDSLILLSAKIATICFRESDPTTWPAPGALWKSCTAGLSGSP